MDCLPRRRNKSNRPDIRAVAREAQVSTATVSRVMNGSTTVEITLAQRVRDVANRLGYVPNTQARALGSGRSRLFGVLISDITNPFFPELVQGFEEKAFELGYETLIGSTRRDPEHMNQCIRRMLERKVDGVAIMTFGIEAPLLDRLSGKGIPMVFVDVGPLGPGVSTITVNYHTGINEAVQHLAVLGHRRIAFIAGPRSQHSSLARETAFRESMTRIGVKQPESYVVEADHTVEGGMTAMSGLAELNEVPTAIVCSNDMTAIGVMHTAFRIGLQIPGDLSVIGFDDIHIARYTLPPLTSIRMSPRQLASSAVLLLKAHVDQPEGSGQSCTEVNTHLVIRETTDIPRGSLSDLNRPPPRSISHRDDVVSSF